MTELILELDPAANKLVNYLMMHYGVNSKADIIKKGIALLSLAAHVDSTEGELLARKGDKETKIIVT